jgi:WD40 repeat protein
MLLAIESMKRSRSFAGDQALRNGLAILPRLEARLGVQLEGSTNTELDINCIAFSPDGRWLATGSQSATVTVWDTTNWHEVMRISHAGTFGVVPVVRSLVFHPNSSWLAVGTDAGTTTIWDVASNHEIAHFNQSGQIFGLAFSPDGSTIASGGSGNVALWESISGHLLYTVSTSSELVVFSPDGNLVAAGGEGDTVKVWGAKSGHVLAEKQQFAHNGYGDMRVVSAIAFSPDSKLIASADGGARFAFTVPRQPVGGNILVWEATTGRDITHMQHDDEVLGLAFSPDGKQLASASYDRTARVWDSHTGEKISSFVHYGPVNALVFSEDGKSIVSVSSDGVGRVWEMSSGKEIARLPTESKVKIEVVAMNSTTHHIAMGDANGRVWVWGIDTAYVTSMPHTNSIASVSYSPDGKLIASASWDKTARVWNAATGQQVAEIPHGSIVVATAFSPDGLWMASGSLTGTIMVWSAKLEKVQYTFQVESVGSLVFSPDGTWLAVGQGDPPGAGWFIQGKRMSAVSEKSNAIVLWNMADGHEAFRLLNPAPARSVAFSPDGKLLVSASDDGTAQVWDLNSGNVISRNYHKYPVNWVSFSPDGKWVASAESCVPQFGSSICGPMVVKIWDPMTGREAWRTTVNGSWVSALSFSPDGKLLAAGNSYLGGCPSSEPECVDTAHVWDVSSGREVSRLAQDKYVTALSFSPDGKWIATGGDDKTLRIWDARTGQELERMTGAQDNEVWSVAFSPDGRWIAAGGYDNPQQSFVRIYPLDSADLIQIACSRLWRNFTADEWHNDLGSEQYQPTCPNIDQVARITSNKKNDSLGGSGYDLSSDGRFCFQRG